jgi:hypothetical protein
LQMERQANLPRNDKLSLAGKCGGVHEEVLPVLLGKARCNSFALITETGSRTDSFV